MRLGDAGEVAQCEAHRWIDVSFDTTLGGSELRELASSIPVEWALAGQCPGQIAEHGQTTERVVCAPEGIVRHLSHTEMLRLGSG